MYLVFSVCYSPCLISLAIINVYDPSTALRSFWLSSCTSVFLDSSVIDCCKMRLFQHAIIYIQSTLSKRKPIRRTTGVGPCAPFFSHFIVYKLSISRTPQLLPVQWCPSWREFTVLRNMSWLRNELSNTLFVWPFMLRRVSLHSVLSLVITAFCI